MEAQILTYLSNMPTILLFVVVAILLFILSKGADMLVDEAVGLSVQWGVPKMIVGATVVSLGTTLPEATVSVMAAINGNPDLALGNAIGSIIADTGLIIGISALLGRLPVDQNIVDKQGKIQFLSGVLLAVVCLPFLHKNGTGVISQWLGVLFIILLIAYIYFSMKWAKNSDVVDEVMVEEERESTIIKIIRLAIGIFLVIGASKILIPSVEILAIRIGIPQSIIAATLVAFGTSLPELVTAITAVRKGHGELAVGNIVGADILNVLFVVGGAAAVTREGLIVPVNFYYLQIPIMLIILGAFRIFSKKQKDIISKKEGSVLLGIYLIYIIMSFIWK